MKLNRHNYEEYFILYVDNELDHDDRREVESFAQENPDLKAELDMLLQSKLVPDTDIFFAGKESLLVRDSSSVSIKNYEQWMLSYIDNELTEEERKDVERFVAAYPAAQTELNLLQKAKLQPEPIVFPHKESLYRREEKAKVISVRWWRIAAAAVLLLGISTIAIILINKKPRNDGGIAKGKPKIENPTKTPVINQQKNITPPVKEEIASIDPGKKESRVKTSNNHSTKDKIAEQKPEQVKQEKPDIAKSEPVKQPSNNLPNPDYNPNVITRKDDQNIANAGTSTAGKLTNSDKKTDPDNVTSPNADTYNKQLKASGNPDSNHDVKYASSQKGGLRGFLRKVTRTFEKKTNIQATDDDDRLLIAGLAIKMN